MSTIRRPKRRRSNPKAMPTTKSKSLNLAQLAKLQGKADLGVVGQAKLGTKQPLDKPSGAPIYSVAEKRARALARRKALASARRKARRLGKKPTSSGVSKQVGKAVGNLAGNFFSRLSGQRADANQNRKKTTSTRRTRSPGLTRVVDPMPNSPERQRRKNRKPVMDPPKGAGKRPTRRVRPKRDNKTVTPVRRARRKPSERFNRGF